MARRIRWVWGYSRTKKYNVNNLTDVEFSYCGVRKIVQVIAHQKIGYDAVVLERYDASNAIMKKAAMTAAKKYINETFLTH